MNKPKSTKVNFKSNAGIKDIVGRGLIYDDNIAIIELIKNSKDAYSPKVELEINNAGKISEDSNIIIRDYGVGMSLADIKDKWLNIAYSEKKNHYKYTNSHKREAFAGNKGVGRFSCDRLGEELILYTTTQGGQFLKLAIDWTSFEDRDIDDEVSSIKLTCSDISEKKFLKESGMEKCEQGTTLYIKKLRSFWNNRKINKLKSELEKFIASKDSKFTVYFNGIEIENKILDKLAYKTTSIYSSIGRNGKYIETIISYRGEPVCTYKAENPYKNLKNIDIEVHFLDMQAKSFFNKKTGYTTNEYGSVFLFHNGFRISPYGNTGNDWLGLDQRKSQGTRRNFGTREIIGRIDIIDDQDVFSVITSREGLAKNNAYKDLAAFDKDDQAILKNGKEAYGYALNIIRQLERFVVSGVKWDRIFDKIDPNSGKVINEGDIQKDPNRYEPAKISQKDVEESLLSVLKISSYRLIESNINIATIRKMQKIANEKYKKFVSGFMEKSGEKILKDLNSYEKRTLKEFVQEEQLKTSLAFEERDIAHKQVEHANAILKDKERTIEQINSENLFLRKTSDQDVDILVDSMHSIITFSLIIKNTLSEILLDDDLSENIMKNLYKISIQNQKIHNISKFASLKNFTDKEDMINGELILFIKKYLEGYMEFENHSLGRRTMNIIDNLEDNIVINKEFIPLDIMMLIENIISNSIKFRAKNIIFSNEVTDKQEYVIKIKDDGRGVQVGSVLGNIDKVFERGFTTTSGSGIGLNHVRKVVEKLKGRVKILKHENSFEIGIYFK